MSIKINLKTLVIVGVSAVFTLFPLSRSYAEEAPETPAANNSSSNSGSGVYTGLINGKQSLPNSMANLCQMNASAIAEDRQMLEKCLQIIASKINAENAADRLDGIKLYENIRLEQLSMLLSESVAKSAAQEDSEKIQDKMTDATDKASTDHDLTNATNYDMSSLARVVDRIREILAEEIKYDMITEVSRIEGESWLRRMEQNNPVKDEQNPKKEPEAEQ